MVFVFKCSCGESMQCDAIVRTINDKSPDKEEVRTPNPSIPKEKLDFYAAHNSTPHHSFQFIGEFN